MTRYLCLPDHGVLHKLTAVPGGAAGVVESANYPDRYNSGALETWVIRATEEGARILLTIEDMEACL